MTTPDPSPGSAPEARPDPPRPSTPWRVAIVCPYEWTVPGGVKNHVHNLAVELRGQGHHVDVLAPAEAPVDEPGFVSLGGSLPIPYNGSIARVAMGPRVAQHVREALLDGAYDLVHVHEPLSPSVGLIAVIQAAVPVVGTFHANLDRSAALRVGSPVLRKAFNKLSVRVAVSESARATWQRYFGGAMAIVPNGVPREWFGKAEPLPAFADGRPTILFVGRLEPRKGVAYLVRAFLRLKPDHPRLRLVVGGADPRNLQAKAMAVVPPRYRPDVQFVGNVPQSDLLSYYASADVFCAPSLGGESFGIVLAEAMATGLPVVASDISGYRDLVTHGREGLLVPPRDPAALARALGELLDDPRRRETMGETARHTAAQYAWDLVGREIAEVYEEVLAADRARRATQPPPARQRRRISLRRRAR